MSINQLYLKDLTGKTVTVDDPDSLDADDIAAIVRANWLSAATNG